MIKYALTCAKDHVFEAWFRNAGACDAQIAAGQVVCPTCGDARVRKALMAPSVRPSRNVAAPAPEPEPAPPAEPPSAPADASPPPPADRAMLMALRGLRRMVENGAESVGPRFAAEARAIHDGEAPERPIYGDCAPEDAEALLEEGVEIAAIPWVDLADD